MAAGALIIPLVLTCHSLEVKRLRANVTSALHMGTGAQVPPVLGAVLLPDVVNGDGGLRGALQNALQ